MNESPRSTVRILLVDDSELVRRGIKAVLAAHGNPAMNVVGEAGSIADALTECFRLKPDVVLLDIRLPDGSGFTACRKILQRLPDTGIIVLTSHANDNFVYEAVIAGVKGYLMKEIDPAALVRAIESVASGRSIFDPDATARVLRLLRGNSVPQPNSDLSILSAQERRVLVLVADGLSNKEVGEQLLLSENTVKNYLANVFEKLKVKTRAQAAVVYTQQMATPPKAAG
jgi:two-component system response regulator DevR